MSPTDAFGWTIYVIFVAGCLLVWRLLWRVSGEMSKLQERAEKAERRIEMEADREWSAAEERIRTDRIQLAVSVLSSFWKPKVRESKIHAFIHSLIRDEKLDPLNFSSDDAYIKVVVERSMRKRWEK